MDNAERYKQDLEFFLDEIKQKESRVRTQRENEALQKAHDLRMTTDCVSYLLEFTTLENLEEAIDKKLSR